MKFTFLQIICRSFAQHGYIIQQLPPFVKYHFAVKRSYIAVCVFLIFFHEPSVRNISSLLWQ